MAADLGLAESAAVLAAGLGAGFINTIAGSGSLLTFPTLLALGIPARTANMSNTVGLVPGSLSGVVGYRRELVGQGRRLAVLAPAAAVGGIVGGLLLLVLPASAFEVVVPFLVALSVALLAAQPRLQRWLLERRGAAGQTSDGTAADQHHGALLVGSIGLVAVYGGYFGAAQGVIFVAVLGVFLVDSLQRINATKNLLALIANLVAALLFVTRGGIAWEVSGLIAIGSIAGGQLGAHFGRRIPADTLRLLIMAVGTAAAARLLWGLAD